jgi:hypothetical protein
MPLKYLKMRFKMICVFPLAVGAARRKLDGRSGRGGP